MSKEKKNIKAGDAYTGGIVGYNAGGYLRACMFMNGSVTGSGNSTGGVAGYMSDSYRVAACGNTGKVSGTGYVGGICGFINYSTYATNPYIFSCWTTNEGIVETDGGADGIGSTSAELNTTQLLYCFAGSLYDINYTHLTYLNDGLTALNDSYRWQAGADMNNDWPVPVKNEG